MTKRFPKEQRKQILLEMAVSIFATTSYDDLSIDDIARHCQISPGLLYKYFDGKAELYIEVTKLVTDRLLDQTYFNHNLGPIDGLTVIINNYLNYCLANRDFMVVMIRGGFGNNPKLFAITDNVRTVLTRRVLDGLGYSKPLSTNQQHIVRGGVSLIEGMTLSWLGDADDFNDADVEKFSQSIATSVMAVLASALGAAQ